jgi:short-subunit dehydrogenase
LFGATSAIGEQVARLFAAEGSRIFLAARDPVRLQAIADDLKVRGAPEVETAAVDFDDLSRFAELVERCEKALGGIDQLLVAYGTLPDQALASSDAQAAARAIHTNFTSPAALLDQLAPRVRGGGTMAVITSVAGDRGRQSNYIYGAAKGGLSRYLEGLRHRMAPRGVKVLDVRPGFVATPMTAGLSNDGPLWAKPEKVAKDIRAAMRKGKSRLYTPGFWRLIMLAVRNVPDAVFHKTKL